MNAVYVELDAGILIAVDTEVEPALRIAFLLGAFTIGGGPHRKLVGLSTHTLAQVTTIEVGVYHHLVAEVVESERILVRYAGEVVFDHLWPVGFIGRSI